MTTDTNTPPTEDATPKHDSLVTFFRDWGHDCRLWVFAPNAHFEPLLTPLLQFPKIGSTTDPEKAGEWLKVDTYPIPEGADPLTYAIDWLRIEPILLVDGAENADLKGVHSNGFCAFSADRKSISLYRWYNEQGLFSDVFLSRRGPFKAIKSMPDEPLRDYKVLQGVSADYFPASPHDLSDLPEDMATGAVSYATAEPEHRLRSIVRTRELDWKDTLKQWGLFSADPLSDERHSGPRRYLQRYYEIDAADLPAVKGSLTRDLCLFPRFIITSDGTIRDFKDIRMSLIKERRWDELKHHFKQLRELIEQRVGAHSPHEMYLVSLIGY